VSCTVSDPDDACQFRLRINQKGAWESWDRVVNSNLGHGPSLSTPRTYPVYFEPIVTGPADENIIFSFDILSFDLNDDASCWLFLDSLTMDKISVPNL
jgi:hypothetical protein